MFDKNEIIKEKQIESLKNVLVREYEIDLKSDDPLIKFYKDQYYLYEDNNDIKYDISGNKQYENCNIYKDNILISENTCYIHYSYDKLYHNCIPFRNIDDKKGKSINLNNKKCNGTIFMHIDSITHTDTKDHLRSKKVTIGVDVESVHAYIIYFHDATIANVIISKDPLDKNQLANEIYNGNIHENIFNAYFIPHQYIISTNKGDNIVFGAPGGQYKKIKYNEMVQDGVYINNDGIVVKRNHIDDSMYDVYVYDYLVTNYSKDQPNISFDSINFVHQCENMGLFEDMVEVIERFTVDQIKNTFSISHIPDPDDMEYEQIKIDDNEDILWFRHQSISEISINANMMIEQEQSLILMIDQVNNIAQRYITRKFGNDAKRRFYMIYNCINPNGYLYITDEGETCTNNRKIYNSKSKYIVTYATEDGSPSITYNDCIYNILGVPIDLDLES